MCHLHEHLAKNNKMILTQEIKKMPDLNKSDGINRLPVHTTIADVAFFTPVG